jgi:hypothetical protein
MTCVLILSACVGDGDWFTPSGVPLGEVDCTSPAPLDGPTGREICLARIIEDSPEAVARCRRDGGRTGPVSVVDRRFACDYRKRDDGTAGGSDDRTKQRSGTGQ